MGLKLSLFSQSLLAGFCSEQLALPSVSSHMALSQHDSLLLQGQQDNLCYSRWIQEKENKRSKITEKNKYVVMNPTNLLITLNINAPNTQK